IEPRHLEPILSFLGSRMGTPFDLPNLTFTPLTGSVANVLKGGSIEAAVEAESRQRNFPDVPRNIACNDVSWALVRKASGLDALCGICSYGQIEADFVAAIEDPSKQAMLICFDSPGGEVGGLFDLVDLIHANQGKKPIYAAVSEMAFSAAYALASA